MMALILSGVLISGIAMPGIAYGEEFYSGESEEMVTEGSVDHLKQQILQTQDGKRMTQKWMIQTLKKIQILETI